MRAADMVASQMSDALGELNGALRNGEAGGQSEAVGQMVGEGTALLEAMMSYLHGEIGRSDVDRTTNKAWLDRAKKLSKSLSGSAGGPAWEPNDPTTTGLELSGTRARGVIIHVGKSGWGNERVASLEMAVSVATPDGSVLEIRRTLGIAIVKAPRVGDHVEVSYDDADPNRFVYRPLIEHPEPLIS